MVLLAPLATGTAGVASADGPPKSWDLKPSVDVPWDFFDYPRPTGWQTDPSGHTQWAFWPTCTGVAMHDGTANADGRLRYCLSSIAVRRSPADPWTQMTPKSQGAAPRSPWWSADWSNRNGRGGLGGSPNPSARMVGNAFLVDLSEGMNDLDPAVEYQLTYNIGKYDMSVMRSVGSGGVFSQSKNANGDTVVTVSSKPGARSIMIPATDVCTNPEARATKSFTSSWSVSLFDKALWPKFAPYEGAVLESDAYGTGGDFPVFDPETGAFSVKVCAPHYKDDGSLNIGYYRLVLTRPMLERAGFFFTDAAGNVVTDARTLTAEQRTALENQARRAFSLTSTEQTDIVGKVTLVVADDGEMSIDISATVNYSAPTISVVRTGPAVWKTTGDTAAGRNVGVRYKTASAASGKLIVELRNQAGRLVSAKVRNVRSTTGGTTDIAVPRSSKAGTYVLRVYIAGKTARGKTKITPVQNLPIEVKKPG